jgi:NADH-quinone oxidoreductase subunit M
VKFNTSLPGFQIVETYENISWNGGTLWLGVDGISLFFIILTALLIPICLVAS